MNKENLLPVGDRYLIEIHQAAGKSASGLVLNNDSNVSAAPVLGTIVAVGKTGNFHVGDKILFRRYSVDELKFVTEAGEQVVHIVEGSEILALIKDKNTNRSL